MKKIIINVIAEDHNNNRLETEGSMMVSDKEYAYFLEDADEMLYHCDEQKDDEIDRICKTAFAKISIDINNQYDLKNIVERYYSEDGKLRSLSVSSYLRGDEWDSSDSHDPRAVQNSLSNIIKIAEDHFAKETAAEER